jgi:hypothetical protein
MNMRNKMVAVTLTSVLAIGVGGYTLTASSQEDSPGFASRLMHGMGHGPGMTGMGHRMMVAEPSHSAITGEMHVIHGLFDNHGLISRTVTNLPDGIRTVTESSDPRVARLIKNHVASMKQRVEAGDDPNVPIESPALHAIFRNKDKIRTTVQTTDNGIIVVQTSSDQETVAVLQQHASEVSAFVSEGISAVHRAMMRNGGTMMHSGGMHERMHERMMRSMPRDRDTPQER